MKYNNYRSKNMNDYDQNIPLLTEEEIDTESGSDEERFRANGNDGQRYHQIRDCCAWVQVFDYPLISPCGPNRYERMARDAETDETRSEQNGEVKGDSAVFEDVLDQTGHFGWYQLGCFLLLSMTDVGAGMSMLFFIFSNALPMWRCTEYEDAASGERVAWNTSEWVKDMSQCTRNETQCVGFEFSGEFASIVSDWELLCDMKYAPKMTVTGQFLGLLFGAAISGYMADKFGRKWTGVGFNTCLALSNFLVGFSPNWYFFSVFRALVGFFAAGVMGIFFTYPTEFVGPNWRVLVSNLEFFSLGHIFMSLIAMWLRNWRHLAWAIACVPLPFIVLICILVPESPRWLIQKKRFAAAEDVARRMAHYNGRHFNDTSLIPRIYASEAHEAEKMAQSTYLDLLRGKEMAIRTLVIGFFWFSVSEMYYGIIVMISSFPGSLYVNSIISAASLYPVRWISLPVMTWLPRKTCLIIYGILSILSMVVVIGISGAGVSQDSYWITGIALAGKAFVTCLWGITGLMTVELYPTLMRNKGVGASSTVSRLGGMLAPQIALLGMVTHWTVPYVTHGVLMLVATILALWLLPETISKPLPEHTPEYERRMSTARVGAPGAYELKAEILDTPT